MEGQDTRQFLRTDSGKTKSNAIEIPAVSLPKGGGAMKGIDEKFSVNAVNGTSSFSIPLPFSAARGSAPALSLSYNSGAGNGIFGLGWSLNSGSIRRKTDKELPQYLDSIDADTFLFSEAEDLVPEFKKNPDGSFQLDSGEYIINERDSIDALFIIRNYLPRIEGLFARIERWTERTTGRIKWRVITKENRTTLFGWTSNSILSDPEEPTRIYEWLPEFMFDDKGNCTQYVYKKEDEVGFDRSLLHHRNRLKNNLISYTNLYLSKVLYGNKHPYRQFGDDFPPESDYLFQTIFDYGTLSADDSFEKINPWDFRADAFSIYKPGFEVRTTRLCKRVLLFHVFEELALLPDKSDQKTLIKSINFGYDTSSEQDFTFLKTVCSYGYIKKQNGSYSYKKLPATEFAYQQHDWNKEIKTVAPDALIHAPVGLDEHQYQFTDLYNEGLSGILTEQANGWYYKHNLGNAVFEQAKLLAQMPSFTGLGTTLRLTDLNADGGKQLTSFDAVPRGFFELDEDNNWQGFHPFKTMPNIDFSDANTRLLDLNGDGKPEVVISEDHVFTWYASEGREGFATARKTTKPADEEAGPHILFADTEQSIYLADMSGDGMTDILRIRNGEVCYWPNLGYGKFGSKVALDHAPVFDHPDAFNPGSLHLGDIDGSGTSDIIYLGKNKFTCWKNLSGNRFGTTPFEIDVFPEIHSQSIIKVADLLGNGLPCIVWSSLLSKDALAPLKYIDLMNSRKPHIMVSYKNNLGKEVSLEYAPSTRFYIEDKLAGRPWVTKLHFPVHCISKTITEDKVSGYKFVTEYKYHHGYYDHAEQEFRGFGMVERIDAETFEHWKKGDAANVTSADLHQEPVVSRSWHHTGAFLQKDKIFNQFAEDYWYAEMERQGFTVKHHEITLPDARLIIGKDLAPLTVEHLSPREWQEALRACKGMTLRSETFARDAIKQGNTEEARKKELIPFSVATQNCMIKLLQPRGKNKHAVFAVTESEAITYNYERNPEDPRIAHRLNVKFDKYANVLESAAVVYPRWIADNSLPAETRQEQSKAIVIYTKNRFTNDVLGNDVYRLRLPSEVKTFELKGVAKSNVYYSPGDFKHICNDENSDTALYHETDKPLVLGKAQKRLLAHVRSIYYRNDLTAALLLHRLESLALPYESYQLAYTPELLSNIFDEKVNEALLMEGKFTHSMDENGKEDANWWIRSGTVQLKTGTENEVAAQNRFYMPVAYIDPYHAVTKVKYYSSYFLFIAETEDALGNKTGVAEFNFRTLSPQRMIDSNNNLSEAMTDELGLVKATATMGKLTQADELTGMEESTENEQPIIDAFFAIATAPGICHSINLQSTAKQLLRHATTRFTYDFENYIKTGQPCIVASITRETHYRKENGDLNPESNVQLSFEYSNGLGEVIMKKVQAEPGRANYTSIGTGNTIVIEQVDTSDTTNGNAKQLRWVGNGRAIKNNKGNTVKQYEPFFSASPKFENEKELVETGVTSILFYDAAGRLMRTELPDGNFSKQVFDSWKQASYDGNDNVLDSDWYLKRTDRRRVDFITDPKEQEASAKTARHANTPHVSHFDTLGRPVLAIEHHKNSTTNADEYYKTKMVLDAEGNLQRVMDARELPENEFKGNTVMQYKYDMLGNVVYQNSMDAGQRWLMPDILGNPLRTWDERDHEFQYFYDVLHRPTASKVMGGDGIIPLNHIFSRIFYGENEPNPEQKNLRGKAVRYYDTGGAMFTPEYNFKGQPLHTSRKLFSKYKEVANWIDGNLVNNLENEAFTFTTETDALGRITRQITPDGSIIAPSYNEAGLLNAESVRHNGSAVALTYIKDIAYNEKGQREKIIYGNDISTKFEYDKETFRLKRLESKRKNGDILQHLLYTYDPVGNITTIEDLSQPVTFFSNSRVEPKSEYTYDTLYRLIQATGKENDKALDWGICDNWNDTAFMEKNYNWADPLAVRRYTQKFQYDAAGNILQMKHEATGGNWTRNYGYESSNNRLKTTYIGDNGTPGSYTRYHHHTQQGFMEELPHLEKIAWNFKEEVVLTTRQRCTNDNIPVTTYYQYDGSGQRIRKITENQAAAGAAVTLKEERIYLSGYELYKKHSGTAAGLERSTLSLIDQGSRFVMIETRNDVADGTEKQLTRYQLHNHLGSAALELDDKAKVISYEEYHPYGTTAYQLQNSKVKAVAKRYRYTGMERDEETGLSYHSARYYLPWLGRWLSADPIWIAGGINVYTYSNSNPISYSDKNGKQADEFVDPTLQALIKDVHNARGDLMNVGTPTTVAGPATAYEVARRQASTGQKAMRTANNMKGAVVQAGHTMQVEHSVPTNLPRQIRDNPATMMALHSRIDARFQVQSTLNAGTPVPSVPGQKETSAVIPWKNTNTRHTAQEALIENAANRPMNGPITQAEARGAQVSGSEEVLWRTQNTPWDQRNAEAVIAGGSTTEAQRIESNAAVQVSRNAKSVTGTGVMSKLKVAGNVAGAGLGMAGDIADAAQSNNSTYVTLKVGTAATQGTGGVLYAAGTAAAVPEAAAAGTYLASLGGAASLAVGSIALAVNETNAALNNEETAIHKAVKAIDSFRMSGEKQGGIIGGIKQGIGTVGLGGMFVLDFYQGNGMYGPIRY